MCQPSATLTREDYALAYQAGFNKTVRFLAASGATRELAEEVAQAAWARGWERLSQLRQVQALTFWINSIAKNLLRSDFRKQQMCAELLETTLVERPLESERIDAHRMFAGCTDIEKKLLTLYYVEGYTSQELSGSLGLSAVGVRVRLTRLKKNLVGRAVLEGTRPTDLAEASVQKAA